jgi:glutamate-1-semialdehyde 2,1-aminomutase
MSYQVDLNLSKSRELFEIGGQIVTGGVHSGFRFREPFPIYVSKAIGSRVWDIDGNEYLDCLVGNGACILGHKHPRVTSAVTEQLQSGLTVGLESELSLEVANMLHKLIPSAEVVKFSNTGTEAVMHALQIVRGYTHKSVVIKTEGCYHGWQDEMHQSVHPRLIDSKNSYSPIPESGGLTDSASRDVAIIPYNDANALEQYLKENRTKVAAVIVEPVMFNSGCVIPSPGYLEALREITEKHGILLIFDEVITGFRLAPGGAQQIFDVKPDISIFGKAIANGFPLSAVVGRKEIMKITNPKNCDVAFSGTYNANQPSLAAAKACLAELSSGKVQKILGESVNILKKGHDLLAREINVQTNFLGIGGQFQIYFNEGPIFDYRSAAKSDSTKYRLFCNKLLDSGVLFHQSFLFHHGVTSAHTKEDLNQLLSAIADALKFVKTMS